METAANYDTENYIDFTGDFEDEVHKIIVELNLQTAKHNLISSNVRLHGIFPAY
jgi:hypothetical protein